MKTLSRLVAVLDTGVPSTLTGLIVLALGAEVVTRTAFGTSLTWTVELSEISFVWVCFLSGAAAFRHGRAIAVDLVYLMLPAAGRRGLRVLVHALVLTVSLYLVWLGVQLSIRQAPRSTELLGLSMAWEIASVPIGMALIAIQAAAGLIAALRGAEERKAGA